MITQASENLQLQITKKYETTADVPEEQWKKWEDEIHVWYPIKEESMGALQILRMKYDSEKVTYKAMVDRLFLMRKHFGTTCGIILEDIRKKQPIEAPYIFDDVVNY